MASKLTQWINASLKNKGMTAKQAQKGAGKFKSISAAKKAGALYYTDKNGKVQIAAYAEDLNKIPKVKMDDPKALKGVIISPRPKLRPKGLDKKKPSRAATEKTDQQKRNEARMANSPGKGSDEPITRKNKGGPVTKKPKGAYAAGGMPMVMKGGKKVPAFAADGVGKMNMGGMAAKKKKPAAKKMMAGGMAAKKKSPVAKKMMGGGMAKKSGYMYGGMAKKKMKK